MGGKVKLFGLIFVCFLLLIGCGNQNPDLIKENNQLKTEVESLKQQVETINNKIKQQEDLYEVRNTLDNNLHSTLRALIKGEMKVITLQSTRYMMPDMFQEINTMTGLIH